MEYQKLKGFIDSRLSIARIADKLSVSCSTVRHWLKKYNLKTNSKYFRKGLRADFKCLNCEEVTKAKNRGKYCSVKCHHNKIWKETKEKIELTKNLISMSASKRYLKEKYGIICAVCRNTSWNNKPIPLVCDHIDGINDNFSLSNIRLICPNCDAQTPTYKGRNIGNGSEKRRKQHARWKKFLELEKHAVVAQ